MNDELLGLHVFCSFLPFLWFWRLAEKYTVVENVRAFTLEILI